MCMSVDDQNDYFYLNSVSKSRLKGKVVPPPQSVWVIFTYYLLLYFSTRGPLWLDEGTFKFLVEEIPFEYHLPLPYR